MRLECLISKVQPVGEILDGSFLTYDNSNIVLKPIKIESLISFLLNIHYCLYLII